MKEMTKMGQKQVLQVPMNVEFITFKGGVPVKERVQVGRLTNGKVLVLEKDNVGNVVGIEFM